MIAGLEEITSGEIWIGGDRVNDMPPRDRDIAMVFQNYALYPHMTVFDNMAFGLKLRKYSKADIKTRVDEAARILDIVPLLERKPKALSGGQRQRVAMGRAIVRHPRVFLFDEPLSNLDAKLRLEMRAEIRRIHNSLGCATVYVTHDQDEALSLADRIVVLRDGQMRQVGTPEALYGRPAHPDVAEFMGYRNVLPTTASFDGGLSVSIGPATLWATAVDVTKPGPAILAIRPEDLSPAPHGPILAAVQTAEYRGRDFFGVARTEEGTELYFRSHQRVAEGEILPLSADPQRILVYAA
jgi:putative spermidine/putrescine transport system ATP-binding protein